MKIFGKKWEWPPCRTRCKAEMGSGNQTLFLGEETNQYEKKSFTKDASVCIGLHHGFSKLHPPKIRGLTAYFPFLFSFPSALSD
ncbi:hypothetical protein H5410_038511 [Solanum commersonii]|uniref:Uncharacterized protein n=1 Tax=Solanum commersonii TaxID=4109 RepID=A0A9J5YBJ8_SOLCO|nr:hypothetical protein H5410_038511 [Solanum commersonii]